MALDQTMEESKFSSMVCGAPFVMTALISMPLQLPASILALGKFTVRSKADENRCKQ